ncbi:CHAT domain-containing protein [Russula compacta]|nr:CHAT domain-containing protein [Russula compacta]
MTTLCRELLTSGVKESLLIEAISLLAATMRQAAVRVVFGKPLPDGAIECLREARRRFPDLDVVRFALATSLSSRFRWAPSHDDYEEAMSILDEIIADDPNEYVELAMWLAGDLARFRYTRESEPEVLADAVFRTRTYLNALSSEHPDRRSIMKDLANLENKRFEEFGVTSGQQEDNAQVVDDPHLAASPKIAKSNHVEFPLPMPDESNPIPHVQALLSIEPITDLTNIEKAIEYCRLCLTSPHSYVPLTILMMGRLLYRVFNLTGNINSLHESITVYRDLIKMEAVPFRPHEIARQLIDYLVSRFTLFNDTRDIDEIMELFAVAAADTSAETPLRFRTSFECTEIARSIRHPSTLHAYQTAISLMQESISFAPTLEIQHFRLVAMRNQYEKLPLDYASYLVEIGQLKQAIEILERGRGLLWSQMRGLRASIVQLRAVNLPLAENFAAVNGELEALTISGSQLVGMEGGPAGVREGMDPFGRLVTKQRKLVEERDKLISQIRAQPGFDSFLIPPSFDTLRSAAAGGPVILINHSEWRSDIIILLHDTSPSLIPTREDFCGHAKRLHDKLLDARKKGLDSFEYEDALEEVLKHLYDLVGRPVIERLRELDIPEQSRVWWCPTSVFCSLPLHAMGPIPSNDSVKLYFSDIYISSYTPTLSALIESRELSTQLSDVPSMLLVVQPDDEIPSAFEEMNIVQAVCPSVETLIEKTATPIVILKYLTKQQFVHISCHGVLEPGKPFDAFFELYKGARLTLLDIVRSLLPSAEFAFLSACHTAEITEKSIANEGLHLAAAVQYSGFRSVVGTMWAVVDDNGPPVAEKFYKSVFSATDRWGGMPHHERTAKALRDAVRDLRKEMTLESWVNYVHYGA